MKDKTKAAIIYHGTMFSIVSTLIFISFYLAGDL